MLKKFRYILTAIGLVLAGSLTLAALPALAQAKAKKAEETAFSRRDYRLGITLTEFKAIPHPDQQAWPNAYPVCSDDERAKDSRFDRANPPSRFVRAGVIGCHFFYDSKSFGPSEAGLKINDLSALTTFLFIKADGEAEPKLFWIVTEGPAGQYDEVMDAFTAAYGKPASKANSTVQNRMGAAFQNTTTRWENGVSYIEALRYGDNIQRFQINYGFKPLMKVFNQRLAGGAGDAKKL